MSNGRTWQSHALTSVDANHGYGTAISCAAFFIGVVAVLCTRVDYHDDTSQGEDENVDGS